MCDFDDDFGDEGFMEDEFFEDCLGDDMETEEPPDGNTDIEGESEGADSMNDEFTAKDAFFIGGAMGWAHEEGMAERRKSKLLHDTLRKKQTE